MPAAGEPRSWWKTLRWQRDEGVQQDSRDTAPRRPLRAGRLHGGLQPGSLRLQADRSAPRPWALQLLWWPAELRARRRERQPAHPEHRYPGPDRARRPGPAHRGAQAPGPQACAYAERHPHHPRRGRGRGRDGRRANPERSRDFSACKGQEETRSPSEPRSPRAARRGLGGHPVRPAPLGARAPRPAWGAGEQAQREAHRGGPARDEDEGAMNVFNRTVMLIIALLLIAVPVIILLIAFGVLSAEVVNAYTGYRSGLNALGNLSISDFTGSVRIVLALAGLLVALIALLLLLRELTFGRRVARSTVMED